MNIITAINDESLFKPLFKDLNTWASWLTFLKALFGLKSLMTKSDLKLYRECTKRKTIPKGGFKEAYALVGRRGGKTFCSALCAVYMSLFGGLEKYLSKGESGWVFCIATDKRQAKIVLDYCKAFLELFEEEVDDSLTWEIRLKNRINIAVRPANFRAGRGYTTICIIADEIAFMRDENSANPFSEIINSLEPGLLDEGMLIGISSVYSRWGYLFDMHEEFYGKEDDVLIWKADTLTMNPTFSQKKIDRMMRRDKSVALAEYYSIFREDIENFLSEQLIAAAMKDGLEHTLPFAGTTYMGFTDSSGGRQDSFTLGIAHNEDGLIIVDKLLEQKPPFNPEETIKNFSGVLKQYGCWRVFGDRYAAEFVSSLFRKNSIVYEISKLTKSEIYLNAQPLFTMNKIRLPKDDKLKTQLLLLERKPRSGGQDAVDHPAKCHDDLANSACGAAVHLQQNYGRSVAELLGERKPQFMPRNRIRKRESEQAKFENEVVEEWRKEEQEEKRIKASKMAKLRERVNG